ncbi:MAG: hypothetical protein GF330_11155 [Candidatus Eisenbacteria bacterium]|nr:hypothetical protein [Candidatus Eisenbacteria bacterium]
MEYRFFSLLAVLGLAVALPAQAVLPLEGESYEIPFPGDQFTPEMDMPLQAELASTSPEMQGFTATVGTGWRALYWNVATDMPMLAAGPPIAALAPGFRAEEEVAASATEFLADAQGLLRLDPADLRYQSMRSIGERAFVFFDQTYEGLPVFTAGVTVSYFHGGINAIEPRVYPEIKLATTPSLSETQAAGAAHAEMPWDPARDEIQAVRLGVLPMVWGQEIGYALAYEVRFTTTDPVGEWVAYVDAHSAEVYWRENHVSYYTIPGTTQGDVKPRRADDEYATLPMRNQYVTADGNTAYSDDEGSFEVEVSGNQYYTVADRNQGYWVTVYNVLDGQVAELEQSAAPYDPAEFYWDDVSTHSSERSCYYHTDLVHSWLKGIDPDWTGNDMAISCRVNVDCTCNAYWQGGTINFCREGGNCNNIGEIADVIYHEYHHWVTYRTYNMSPPPSHTGLNEGYSDYCAMAITDDCCMAPSFYAYNPDGCLRTGMNYRLYPAPECGGEEHCVGEITMGAMWKTRRNLTQKYGDGFAHDVDVMFREAVVGRPNTVPTFLTYLMMANDDDGNIANGSPDYWEICDAWTEHNVPCPLITIYIDFAHTPLEDVEDVSSPILVSAEITPEGGCGEVLEDSTAVFYSYDGVEYFSAPMSNIGGDTFEGYIPPSAGRLVDYYLRSVSADGIVGTEPIRAPEVNTHRFLIGTASEAFADDIEDPGAWTVGAPDDDATDGLFECVDPEGKLYDTEWVQPEDDHTPAPGVCCFVTDGRGGFYANYDVDAGKTSVITPALDLSQYGDGYIDFHSFLAIFGAVVDDSLTLHVSPDGVNWELLWAIEGQGWNDPDFNYHKIYFRRGQCGGSSAVRFKFTAEDNENNSITEAAIDDVSVYVTSAGAVEDGPVAADLFWAAPATPSVFSRATMLRFQLPARSDVDLRIYDVGGRTVRTLLDEPLESGMHTAQWDGMADGGRLAPSGIYYYVLQAGNQELTRKLVLTR